MYLIIICFLGNNVYYKCSYLSSLIMGFMKVYVKVFEVKILLDFEIMILNIFLFFVLMKIMKYLNIKLRYGMV